MTISLILGCPWSIHGTAEDNHDNGTTASTGIFIIHGIAEDKHCNGTTASSIGIIKNMVI